MAFQHLMQSNKIGGKRYVAANMAINKIDIKDEINSLNANITTKA